MEMAALNDPMIPAKFKAEVACERAFMSLQSSNMEAARANYDEALRLDPVLVPALRGRAAMAQRRGDHAASLLDMKAAVAIEPNNPEASAELATVHWWLGELDAAVAAISKSIRLVPAEPRYYQCRGDIQVARKHVEEAIVDFTEVIRLDETSVKAHSSRGFAHYRLRNWAGMEEDGEALVRLDITNGVGYKIRGMAREMQGRYNDALADFESALLLRSDRMDIRLHRGLCRTYLGDASTGLADAYHILDTDPTIAEAYYLRSLARHALRDHMGARSDIDEAVRRKPDATDILTARARTLATCVEDRARNGKEALDSAYRAVELTKGHDHNALDALALALAETGDYRAAVARQWETIRHDPAGKAHPVDFFRLVILALRLKQCESSDAPAPRDGDRLSLFAAPLERGGFVVKIAHDGVFQLSLYRLWSLPLLIPSLEIYPKNAVAADARRPTDS
jgi:tetratricopeptide (TPR) repeat protein